MTTPQWTVQCLRCSFQVTVVDSPGTRSLYLFADHAGHHRDDVNAAVMIGESHQRDFPTHVVRVYTVPATRRGGVLQTTRRRLIRER